MWGFLLECGNVENRRSSLPIGHIQGRTVLSFVTTANVATLDNYDQPVTLRWQCLISISGRRRNFWRNSATATGICKGQWVVSVRFQPARACALHLTESACEDPIGILTAILRSHCGANSKYIYTDMKTYTKNSPKEINSIKFEHYHIRLYLPLLLPHTTSVRTF